MILKSVDVLVTNASLKKLQDGTDYCAVGILSLDDGQKFDLSVRDPEVYSTIVPMTKAICDLSVTNSKYGIKLNILNIETGLKI